MWRADVTRKLKTFFETEDGAVTVDWVVLTALVLGVQIIMLMTPIRNALVGVSTQTGGVVDEYQSFLNP